MMSPDEFPPDDLPLDALLAPPSQFGDDLLRSAILRQTRRRLTRRRWLRRLARVALPAVCFAAGMVVMALRNSPRAEPHVVTVAVPVERPAAQSVPPAVKKVASPEELELEAERSFARAESARRFREAGDRYLRELADYRAALRCYRNYLDEAEDGALAASADDTWLLTSLKDARRKETENARVEN
jgi:hypothetical protein